MHWVAHPYGLFGLRSTMRVGPFECWPWTGSIRKRDGYGVFAGFMAHRYMWEFMVGPIPDGYTIDHLCARRDCVNPYHLEPVTRAENARRSWESTPVRSREPREEPLRRGLDGIYRFD